MTLIIIHYHLRPGGIRRVIELATPHICRHLDRINRVIIACGEARDGEWRKHFTKQLRSLPVHFFVHRAFGYFSEHGASAGKFRASVAASLNRLLNGLTGETAIVWAHNLGIGRNLILADELVQACQWRDIPLISHHHDWWFDNRWPRWKDIRRSGIQSLDEIGEIIFPAEPVVRHAAINFADASVLKRYFGEQSGWLPNPASDGKAVHPADERKTRRWLDEQVGNSGAPIWILPARLLRRKNIAEALLLARWLRPDAWLITTGGPSSRDEIAYYEKLNDAVRKHDWHLELGVLAGGNSNKPSVADLIAASECVMLTSIQEGFGLPYLEAAAAKRPLIARSLPNIKPDLARFGFRFPQYYDEVMVDTRLFDWENEQARQREKFSRWCGHLPRIVQGLITKPPIVAARKRLRAVPFSHLTMDAQIEVISQPADYSWKLCAPLNRFLRAWKQRAASKRLQVTRWPKTADQFLSGQAYAERFARLLTAQGTAHLDKPTGRAAHREFIRKKLAEGNTYPLLWDSNV